MAEPDVVRVAREYREQLARNEDAALKRMSRFWVKMERGLMADYQALAQEVLDRKAAGMPVPRQFIYTMERYRSMMEQIQKEMPYYQTTVEDLIKQYQSKNYQLGIDGANEIIKAAHPSSDVWTKVYKDAAETAAGFAGNGAPLHDLLQTDYGASSERILDSLVSGVGLGKGYKEIARDMADAMAYDYDRSMRIARTEINRSYRLANAEQYRRSGVVEKVLRLCFKPTACFACLEMDGEECPRGICEDHPNGKCTTIVVTTGGVVPDWEKGSEWLMYQSEEDQRRIMGDGRFDLWKNFGVDPRDMVYMKPNDVWGAAPAVRSLKELKGGESQRFFSAPENRDMASGMRQPVYRTLTDEEISALKDDIRAIEADESVFKFNEGTRTGYRDDRDRIYVRGDVLPDPSSTRARDRMSARAVLAHEYYGHRAYKGTKLKPGVWNDEFRASYMAAKNAPGLSALDRYHLVQDALDRAAEANVKIRYNQFIRGTLYGGISE